MDARPSFAELHLNIWLTSDRRRLPANIKRDMEKTRALVMTSVGGRMKPLG